MKRADLGGVFAEAWRAWKRDRAVLVVIAGLFLFVPILAMLGLMPDVPPPPESPTPEQAAAALQARISAQFPWLLGVQMCALFGVGVIHGWLLSADRPALSGAIGRTAAAFFRLFAASLLVALMAGTVALLLASPAVASFGAIGLLFGLPALYLLARGWMVVPAAVIERTGVIASIARSFALTRGRGWLIAWLIVMVSLAGQLLIALLLAPLAVIAQGSGEGGMLDVVVNVGAALVGAATALSLALLQAALYVRCDGSRSGI